MNSTIGWERIAEQSSGPDDNRLLFSNYCLGKRRPSLCHLDRSAAQWRDLRSFPRRRSSRAAKAVIQDEATNEQSKGAHVEWVAHVSILKASGARLGMVIYASASAGE